MKRSKQMIEERLKENNMELEYEKIVRDNVVHMMAEKNKTQADLAEIMCCSKSHVNDLLQGKAHFYLFEVELLAKDLNCDEYSFLSFFCKPNTPELIEEEVRNTLTRMGISPANGMKILSVFVKALKEITGLLKK